MGYDVRYFETFRDENNEEYFYDANGREIDVYGNYLDEYRANYEDRERELKPEYFEGVPVYRLDDETVDVTLNSRCAFEPGDRFWLADFCDQDKMLIEYKKGTCRNCVFGYLCQVDGGLTFLCDKNNCYWMIK